MMSSGLAGSGHHLNHSWLPVWLPKIQKGFRIVSETPPDLLYPVGTTGFEPATP